MRLQVAIDLGIRYVVHAGKNGIGVIPQTPSVTRCNSKVMTNLATIPV